MGGGLGFGEGHGGGAAVRCGDNEWEQPMARSELLLLLTCEVRGTEELRGETRLTSAFEGAGSVSVKSNCMWFKLLSESASQSESESFGLLIFDGGPRRPTPLTAIALEARGGSVSCAPQG